MMPMTTNKMLQIALTVEVSISGLLSVCRPGARSALDRDTGEGASAFSRYGGMGRSRGPQGEPHDPPYISSSETQRTRPSSLATVAGEQGSLVNR